MIYVSQPPTTGSTGSGGFSWEIIPPLTKVVIPYGQQMLVIGDVTVEQTGELDIEGSLIILREDI